MFVQLCCMNEQSHPTRAETMFAPANERRRYNVTPSLIGRVQA